MKLTDSHHVPTSTDTVEFLVTTFISSGYVNKFLSRLKLNLELEFTTRVNSFLKSSVIFWLLESFVELQRNVDVNLKAVSGTLCITLVEDKITFPPKMDQIYFTNFK